MDDFLLLPTGKPAVRGQLILTQDGLRTAYSHMNQVYPDKAAQHLYQLGVRIGVERKIIASTNPVLGLPVISRTVIKQYVHQYNQAHYQQR